MSKSSDLEPVYSLVELARGWAEVTGDTTETILYRLGDWAMTDAFPDDAFLTNATGAATFKNESIFWRMLWHQQLSEKISKEGDPGERERLQKFADAHMQFAEIAVLRREVLINACRAMDVDPPPIIGLLKGSAAHATPPELAPDTLVRVGRDHEPLRRRDIMAPDEAKHYTLLWDAAAVRSRSNGQSLEWNWLRLMDRFWRGQLSRSGLVYFLPGHPGREFAVFERQALAHLLLGCSASDRKVPVETLCSWTMADYLSQPDPFCDYFRRDSDGRVGLAARIDELTRRRDSAISSIEMSAARGLMHRQDQPQRKKLAYYGLLERFIMGIKRELLAVMSVRGARIQFEDHHQKLLNDGQLPPPLPRDRRNIERQISRIREKILVPGSNSSHQKCDNTA